jgi:type II secretion system protein N
MKTKWFSYVLFALILTVCFLYALFPSDQLKNFLIFHLNKNHADIKITIDRIIPAFPPGIRLYNVNVYQMTDPVLIMEKIKLAPDLLSLFRPDIVFFFKANTCGGIIDGSGTLARNSAFKKINVDATVKDVQLAKIHAMQGLNRRNISGVLEGRLTYTYDPTSGEDVKATIVIADGKIELLNPILMLDAIALSSIESSFVIKNRSLHFKKCSFEGDQMDGIIAGSVVLQKPLERSVLKLVGTIRPNPTLLADLEKDLPKNLIPRKVFSKNGLSIKLNGTIEKPIFSMN